MCNGGVGIASQGQAVRPGAMSHLETRCPGKHLGCTPLLGNLGWGEAGARKGMHQEQRNPHGKATGPDKRCPVTKWGRLSYVSLTQWNIMEF